MRRLDVLQILDHVCPDLPELWPSGRVSAWQPGDQGSIPGPVRPQTVKKWDPMPPCLALSMKGWIGGSSLRCTSVMSRGCISPLVHQDPSR